MAEEEALGRLVMRQLTARRERGCRVSPGPALMSDLSTLGVAVPLMNLNRFLHLSLA